MDGSSKIEATKTSVSLVGNWAQDGKEFDDAYQAGFITKNRDLRCLHWPMVSGKLPRSLTFHSEKYF